MEGKIVATIKLGPETIKTWESNIKVLDTLQPRLAEKLRAWVDEHGHEFEHEETESASGMWVKGLTEKPFFQPAEVPAIHKKDAKKPVVLIYGMGVPPYLFKVLRKVASDLLAIVVVEPNLALLAYTFHLT